MNTAILTATVVLVSAILLITGSHETPPQSSPAPGGCADSVISFSPCLPYISSPPNDLSDDPSSQCCEIFNGAFDSGEAECLCYLVRQSTLLGFPINASKLLSLSDLCSLNNQTNNTDVSLQSICSGSPTLPPLMSTTNKPHSGSKAPPPPPPPPSTTTTTTTTTPSSGNNASRPPTSQPSTSSQQRNNGNYLEPARTIVLLSLCLYFLFKSFETTAASAATILGRLFRRYGSVDVL